jgi:hypothetical protein
VPPGPPARDSPGRTSPKAAEQADEAARPAPAQSIGRYEQLRAAAASGSGGWRHGLGVLVARGMAAWMAAWAAVEAAPPEPGVTAGTAPQADASLSTTTRSLSAPTTGGGDAGSTPACSPFLPAGTDQIVAVLTQMTLAHAHAGQRYAPAPDQEADDP